MRRQQPRRTRRIELVVVRLEFELVIVFFQLVIQFLELVLLEFVVVQFLFFELIQFVEQFVELVLFEFGFRQFLLVRIGRRCRRREPDRLAGVSARELSR